MSAPRIPREGREAAHNARPQRVEMDVAHELQEIGFFVHQGGAVAILHEVADPFMATVEGAGIPGQESSHCGGEDRLVWAIQLGRRRSNQEVQVVREQRPRKDGEPGPVDDLPQASDELGVILLIAKE